MSGRIVEDKSWQTWIVISVAFASFMAALDTYIVNVALPTIAHYFNVGTSDVALVTLAYLLIITSTLPIFGKLGDRIGFKTVFILGFAFFSAGSLLCGLSPHIYLLVGSRCVQGVGAAMLYAVGMALIPRHIPDNRRGWAFGITATLAGMGVVIGAPLGGVITQYFSWHWIFLINVPVGIAAIFVALRVVPEVKPETSKTGRKAFDIPGAILSFIGLAALVSALNRAQEIGWHHPGIMADFVLSAGTLTGFILWERKSVDPLLDLRLFNINSFKYGAFAAFFPWATFAGGNFLLPFYLQLDKGLQPSQVGALFLISSLIYIIISPMMGRLSDRTGSRILCCIGAAGATGALIFFVFTLGLASLAPVLVYLALIGLFMGAFVPPNNSLTLSSVPEDSQGAASAASRALMNLGMVLGVAIFETIFTAVLPDSALNTNLTAGTVPADILNAGFRNAFIAGAVMCFAGFVLSSLSREDRTAPHEKDAGNLIA